MASRRIGVVVGLLLVLIGGAVFFALRLSEEREVSTPKSHPEVVSRPPTSEAVLTPATQTLPGEDMLQTYLSEEQSAVQDMRQIQALVTNALFIVKRSDLREYATNEDLADFLRGKNQYQQAMLPAGHHAFDERGRLIDRWGNPLVVHPFSSKHIEIFAAGPDGVPWNEDDVGRRPQQGYDFLKP